MADQVLVARMQHAFTTGEMSPSMLGRQDVSAYASGLMELENFLIAPQGPILNDTGTVFVDEVKDSTKTTVKRRFVFSRTQAYSLEFGHLYVRFFTDGGRIENPPGTPYEVVTPYTEDDVRSLQINQSGDILYITCPGHWPKQLERFGNLNWTLVDYATTDGPYLDANLDITQTITASGITGSVSLTANTAGAFAAGNIGSLIRLEEAITTKYDQWASGVCYPANYVVTNAGGVYQVSNGGSDTTSAQRGLAQWVNATAYPNGYYSFWGVNCYRSSSAGTSGTTPPTHVSGTVSDGGVNWDFIGLKSGSREPTHLTGVESDGNLSWTFLHAGFGIAKITAVADGTHATATVISRLPASVTGGTVRWRRGAWDDANGYPKFSVFYLDRLWFLGTDSRPQDGWGSCDGDYGNHAPTDVGLKVLDTNAIHFTIKSTEVNSILWARAQTKLLIGTSGGNWVLQPGNNTAKSLAPDNIQINPQTTLGSSPVPGLLVGSNIIYIHESGNRVYEQKYDYVQDTYVPDELTLMADHILQQGGGAIELAFQSEPFPTLWIVRADGVLVGCTYLSEQKVIGFHRHTFAGGKVESISVIPGQLTSGADQVWAIVNRTINGQQKRYVEYLRDLFRPTDPQDKADMWYVQCGGIEISGTPIDHVDGLDWLEGETVVAIVDGAVQPTAVVTGGRIDLQDPGLRVVVGLPYVSRARVLPIDFDGPQGTMQGQEKSVARIILRLLNSLGYSYGPGDTFADEVSFFDNTSTMDASPDLVTGDLPSSMPMGTVTDGTFTIAQTQPYPLNILGIIYNASGLEQPES